MKEYDKTYFAKRLDNIDFFLFATNLYHYVQDDIYHCMRIEIDIYGNQNHVYSAYIVQFYKYILP